MLRVAIALGFGRGRVKSVYQILRGKDLETGEFSPERRDSQFKILQEAQARCWISSIGTSSFRALWVRGSRSVEMISSQNALPLRLRFLSHRQGFDAACLSISFRRSSAGGSSPQPSRDGTRVRQRRS